ncbi:MAG: hypothetical protein JWL80_38 [Parcubacteria group bacterium]|nr:hypothetical protein [Parcubacteria group bacterium]
MKHIHTLGAILILASVATPALALEGNLREKTEVHANATNTVRTEIKKVLEQKKENVKEVREKAKESKEALKDELHQVKVEFKSGEAKGRQEMAVTVLNATIGRLENIISRIESRLAKFEASGIVTTEARADVNLAKTDLVSVRAHVATLSALDLTGSTTTQAANFKIAQTEAKAAREGLTSARQNLEKALRVVRDLEKKVKGTATSTSSN